MVGGTQAGPTPTAPELDALCFNPVLWFPQLCYKMCLSPESQGLHVTPLSISSGIAPQIKVLRLHQNWRGSTLKMQISTSTPVLLNPNVFKCEKSSVLIR